MRATALLLTILFAAVAPAAPSDVAPYLQEISVTIHAAGSQGSGVIVTRYRHGTAVNFVWTAAHVLSSLRRSGSDWDDATVVQELVEEGRRVGEVRMLARVVRVCERQDLALLQIRKRGFSQASAQFYLEAKVPPVGTRLYHVGSMLGQIGSNSMTEGIVSQVGRVLDNLPFDQTSVIAFPGCSGGGVYQVDGRYVGMIVRGAGAGFNLIVPVRRMCQWARQARVLWALDDRVELPTPEQLESLPREGGLISGRTQTTRVPAPTMLIHPIGQESAYAAPTR